MSDSAAATTTCSLPVLLCQSRGAYSYAAQAPPAHRTQRRTALRVCRTVVLATHTPLILVLPGPQAAAISMTMSFSGTSSGAGVNACAELASTTENAATDSSLIMCALPAWPRSPRIGEMAGSLIVTLPVHALSAGRRVLEIDQGPDTKGVDNDDVHMSSKAQWHKLHFARGLAGTTLVPCIARPCTV